jgi:hypothetical protein
MAKKLGKDLVKIDLGADDENLPSLRTSAGYAAKHADLCLR